MDAQQRNDLRKALRRHYGIYKEICERSSPLNNGQPYSYSLLRKVVAGERDNDELLLLAAKVLQEYEEKKAQRRAELEAAMQRVRSVALSA